MTASAIPQGFDRLTDALGSGPRRGVVAALALILAGALVTAAPDHGGAVVGGTAGWAVWFSGITILSIWVMLMLGGRPVSALLIAGGVAAVTGALLFYHPDAGTVAIAILAISTLVMDGGIQLTLALKLRPAGVWRWLFASALSSAIAAVVLSGVALFGSAGGWAPVVGLALMTSGLGLLMLRQTLSRPWGDRRPDAGR